MLWELGFTTEMNSPCGLAVVVVVRGRPAPPPKKEADAEVSDSVETSEGHFSEGRRSCGCSTDCTCRGPSSDRVSEQGSAVSVESWETDPRSGGNVSAQGARWASFVTRALPVDCCR